MEIVKTGDLERIKYERTEDAVVAQLFTKIYGVGEVMSLQASIFLSFLSIGPVLARQWYLEGLRTLDDVRDRKNGIKLSPHQKVCVSSRSVVLGAWLPRY
jgi:DNA polymerase lambda